EAAAHFCRGYGGQARRGGEAVPSAADCKAKRRSGGRRGIQTEARQGMSHFFFAGLSVITVVAVRAAPARTGQTPEPAPIFVDYLILRSALRGCAEMADAVVWFGGGGLHVEITADAQSGRSREGTKSSLTLLEILNPHAMLPPVPAPLTIHRLGGE